MRVSIVLSCPSWMDEGQSPTLRQRAWGTHRTYAWATRLDSKSEKRRLQASELSGREIPVLKLKPDQLQQHSIEAKEK